MQRNGLEGLRARGEEETEKKGREIKQEIKQAGLPITSCYALQNLQVSFLISAEAAAPMSQYLLQIIWPAIPHLSRLPANQALVLITVQQKGAIFSSHCDLMGPLSSSLYLKGPHFTHKQK